MTNITDMPYKGLGDCEDVLSFLKKWGKVLHDDKTSAARMVANHKSGINGHFSNGCFAGLSHYVKDYDFIIINAGDGVDLSVADLVDQKRQEQRFRETKLVFNTLTPTPRSRRWVEFLLSTDSPWKALHPFLMEKDTDFCNEVGFIFGNKNCVVPTKLVFNFAMASRFPWEMPQAFSLYLALLDEGIESRQACFIANNFVLRDQAAGLNGPYEIVYPWSFLESLSLEAAASFCLSAPLNLNTNENTHPNCEPLWVIKETKDKWFQRSNDLSEQLLELPQILETLNEAIEDQKQYLKG